jgi:hypothetical protein
VLEGNLGRTWLELDRIGLLLDHRPEIEHLEDAIE